MLKKIGYLCMSIVPMIGYLLLSMVATIVVMVMSVIVSMKDPGRYPMSEILEVAPMQVMLIGAISGAIALLCYGLWYRFGCKTKVWKLKKQTFTVKHVGILLLLALFLQYTIGYVLNYMGMLLPTAMETYMELMETTGIGDITVLGILYGVLIGPMAEELVFRGVSFFYAKKVTSRFWVANVIQSVLFGIFHLNLIQGIYAFFLGLLLGWICEKFHSVFASMVLHVLFNMMAFGPFDAMNRILPSSDLFQIPWMIFTFVATFGLLAMLKKEKKKG